MNIEEWIMFDFVSYEILYIAIVYNKTVHTLFIINF